MKIDIKQAQKWLDKWQDILRLKDWDIKLHLVNSEWRKTGDIKIDRDNRQAILMLNNFNPKRTNIEGVLVHELIHLRLWNMDQMIEELIYMNFGKDEADPKFQFAYNKFMITLEATTEEIARNLMQLGGENKEISFGKLEKEVESEVIKNKKQI